MSFAREMGFDYLLANEELHFRGFCYDSRKYCSGQIFLPYIGEKYDSHEFVKDLIARGLKSTFWQKDHFPYPSFINLILVDSVNKTLFDLAYHYQKKLTAKKIGITGTNGKTSTKEFIGQMLQKIKGKTYYTEANNNNEIGICHTILDTPLDTEYLILEMGLEKIGDLTFATKLVDLDVAIITSVGHAHLNYLMNQETVAREKAQIINGMNFHKLLIYHHEDSILNSFVRKKIYFKTYSLYNKKAMVHVTNVRKVEQGLAITVHQFGTFVCPFYSKGQVRNLLAAITLLKMLKISHKEILQALKDLQTIGSRNNHYQVNGYYIYDDSYKANYESMKDAIESLGYFTLPKVLVLGDMLDLGRQTRKFHQKLADIIVKYQYASIVLYGNHIQHLYQRLVEDGVPQVHYFRTFNQIVEHLVGYREHIILFKASNGLQFRELVDQFVERIQTYE